MTMRVYLQAVKVFSGPPQTGDLPAERLFIHASEPSEVWVETESSATPAAGKSVAFSLPSRIDLGINRVTGTIERKIEKGSKTRIDG